MTTTQQTTLNALGIAPILTVDDLDKSMRFYEGLGFGLEERFERDGQLRGVMLRAGEARLNLTQDDWGKGRGRTKGIGFRIFVLTSQDMDELAAKVKAAGIPLEGPVDAPWGRSITATDPDGFKVTISRQS
ncbi:MAG: VOC family protein [Gemmatimonadota bacterium]